MSRLTGEKSISVLLEEMSIEEKIDLLVGKSAFSTMELPKYGIPSIRYLDGATGVNLLQLVCELAGTLSSEEQGEEGHAAQATELLDNVSTNESGGSVIDIMGYITGEEALPAEFSAEQRGLILTLREKLAGLRPEGGEPNCFPPGMLLGATWNPGIVFRVAEAVAAEAAAYGVDVLLGTPNTNIHRDPRNGRLFESFSEDPYLSRRMAPEFCKGVQSQGVASDVKHFAANNQETLRQGIDERISERALREIYLPGFEAAVKEGDVSTVMSAYNSINGVPCAQNHWLLTQVLKEEWGFRGQVVSDWGAVSDQTEALNAGNDMDMPGPRGKQSLIRAVKEGKVSRERLDDAVERTLRMILKTPAFCGRRFHRIDDGRSQEAAYLAAADGITLLKNEGVLPLKEGTSVSLYGHLSKRFMESGSGSAQVDTSKHTGLWREMGRFTDRVLFEQMDSDTDVVVITAGASGQEGKDRPDMRLDAEDERMLQSTLQSAREKGKKTIVLLNIAGPVELGEYLKDIDALLCVFFPGGQGARAAADILFGRLSPSGKLPLTFPKNYRDAPTAINFPGEYGRVDYGEGIFVGYRYYDFKGIEPMYPFGFGLSYSSFSIRCGESGPLEYENTASDALKISAVVKNQGPVRAKEVVQLYIRDVESALAKPDKELKGFSKVELEPGEEKEVLFELCPWDFASYDTDLHEWTVEPGEYEVLIGNSSRNICGKISVRMTGRNPYGLSGRSSLSAIVGCSRAVEVCGEVLGSLFDEKSFRSNARYFGSTRLDVYLERTIAGFDKTDVRWKQKMELLNRRLESV